MDRTTGVRTLAEVEQMAADLEREFSKAATTAATKRPMRADVLPLQAQPPRGQRFYFLFYKFDSL